MLELLFTNTVTVKNDPKEVRDFLLKLPNILQWNPEISEVKQLSADTFKLLRRTRSLNDHEILKIERQTDKIIYKVKGSKVDYSVEFFLQKGAEGTVIAENLYLAADAFPVLPKKFVKIILARSFKQILNNLAFSLSLLSKEEK